MKITSKLLNSIGIYSSYNIAGKVANKLFIAYSPATNGLGARYAQWGVHGMGFITNPSAHWQDYGANTFVVTCRENKEPKLQEAIAWVKEKYGLDITERDVWGSYHVTGTMDKLKELLKEVR